MNANEYELWKALDHAVFGEDEAGTSMDRLRDQYDKERSSLGRYLTSLRDFKEWSVEKMAHETGVPPDIWRAWEIDYLTPTARQLDIVADRLGWRSRKRAIAAELREQASRFRLHRLTDFRPEVLAARGELDRGGLAWKSIDEATREKICQWGAAQGHDFPTGLTDFLRELRADAKAREAWINEILGG